TETTVTGLKRRQENNGPVTTADQPLVKSSNTVLPADKEKKGNTKSDVAQASGIVDSVSVASGKESPESASNAATQPSYAAEPAAAPPAAARQKSLADLAKTETAVKEKSAESDTLSRQREDAKPLAKD